MTNFSSFIQTISAGVSSSAEGCGISLRHLIRDTQDLVTAMSFEGEMEESDPSAYEPKVYPPNIHSPCVVTQKVTVVAILRERLERYQDSLTW